MRLSTRLTLAMVALVLLTAAAIGLLAYRNIEATELPRALSRIDDDARVIATVLEVSVRSTRSDVIGFRSAAAIDGIIRANLAGGVHPLDGTTEAQWRGRLASRFAAELAAKPEYAQFRLIGIADGGRELVRVDRSGPAGAIRVAPDASLQPVGDEDYFKATIGLPAGEVHVSPVDLNRERGLVETPHVPTLRTAAPVFAPDGRVFGIVMINVDLRPAFARIRAAARGDNHVYLANERGDYLVHPDPAREFAFEFGTPIRVQDDFPELTQLLGKTDAAPRVIQDRVGARFGIGWETVSLAGGPRVSVIETNPYSDLIATATAVRDSSLLGGLAAVLGALALAIVFARSLTRPLVQMTRLVEGFARQEAMEIPVNASGEIGVLARAFAQMGAAISEKTAALEREIEERTRIFETSPDLILVTDREGNFLRVSPSSLPILGYRPDEMIDRSAADFIFPDDLDPTRGEMRAARRGKLMRNFETRYVHKDGRVVTLTWTGMWLDPEKQHFFIGRDVTDRRLAEEQLRQAQKMEAVGQLTGGIAHDFNNMLTVITGTIEILAEAVADKPQLAAVAELISEAADRGAELTSRLLAFARKQPLQPKKTDVNALIVGSTRLLRPSLGEHVEIETRLEENAWPALIDPTQLTTALVNLAVNARDAMPNGGKLTLETGNVVLDESYAGSHSDVQAGPYVMLAVSDTGTGIPEAIREKVFEPFFSTKDAAKGTGLGLSMVYGFVKQSGGHIKIYSEEGHGTTIKLYLPGAGEHADRLAHETPSSAIRGGKETILVVEDDAMVRSYVTAQLQSLGYTILSTDKATEALALIDNGAEFDLLFTDVIMPGPMNGTQLAEEAAKRRSPLKVLFTSGYTENALIHHQRLDPGVLLLAKPYRKADLARMVRVALGTDPRPEAAPMPDLKAG